MKKFFKEEDKAKEQHKFIELTSDINWDEIKDSYEVVDVNGEEHIQEYTTEEKEKEKEKELEVEDNKEDKKKKKKNKNKKK